MANPGYLTPPTGLEYYVLGRDPFRTEATYRTDLSVNYGYRLGGMGDARPELFFHSEVLNIFNQFQLCGCGGTSVFVNGGNVNAQTINQVILTPVTNGATYQAFNPFTTTPVKGVNWDLGPTFGQAQNRFVAGLNWMNAHSQSEHRHDFLDCTPEQQNSVLEELAYRARFTPRTESGRAFFRMMRDYTVVGYYTTRIGLESLGYPGLQVAWPAMPGCPHADDPEHVRLRPVGDRQN